LKERRKQHAENDCYNREEFKKNEKYDR
jgi:hypothetical protein